MPSLIFLFCFIISIVMVHFRTMKFSFIILKSGKCFIMFVLLLSQNLNPSLSRCKKKSLTAHFRSPFPGSRTQSSYQSFCFLETRVVWWWWWWSWIFIVALLLGICDRFRSVRVVSSCSLSVPQPNQFSVSLPPCWPFRCPAARCKQCHTI